MLIKCGGSVLDELTPAFFNSLKELEKEGYQLIFVHGGGPDINKMLDLYNVPQEFDNGLRKTTSEAMEIVEMVLAGKTNRKLSALLESHGIRAFGLNGSDGRFLQGEFINKKKLGFVGEITNVKTDVISMLLREHYTPVITPIAITDNGIKLNINADFAAAAIGIALNVEHCIFVTDVDGIIIDGKLRAELSTDEIEQNILEGEITGGMIPKVTSATSAIGKGLQSVMIVSGKNNFYDKSGWTGTKIYAKERVIR
ncbi:acetylglutamate kinase [Bacillus sp. FJAT-29790]|uniref:acetylglutamate kinase n=1 Tax=Bacillus sp. FJAT-29790 TaxID=1895002 RepID=UPI00349F9F70